MTSRLAGMAAGLTLGKSLLIPLGVFAALVVFLALGFGLKDPHYLPSALVGKPFPQFELRDLADESRLRSRDDLLGTVSLVNVWATWCPNCLVEHPELMRVASEGDVPVYGVNYNDDTEKARAWLARHGDPYRFSVVDDEGRLAIDLGVYGAPETFVVDRQGMIRLRHVGPVTARDWRETLAPAIELARGG